MENVNKQYVGKKYFVREELNGITVYNKITHMFEFYENIFINDIKNIISDGELEEYLSKYDSAKTKNIKSKYPFYIGWQLSNSCNLDSIYCFAEVTLHNKRCDDIVETANEILKLNPICVGLSGGEPTLEPKLADIMRLFKDKTTAVLNTNGTTKNLEELIPVLKETNTFVRLTIDSTDNELLNKLRPPRKMPEGGYNQIEIIKKHVKMLVDNDINFMIHTVMTQQNMKTIEKTGQDLIDMGVKRWHMYKVDCSLKCQSFFDDIKVGFDEMKKNHENLIKKYGDKMEITSAFNPVTGNRERAILLVDSTGRFLVKDDQFEPVFIGKDPAHPTYEEIMTEMDYEKHKFCYLKNLWTYLNEK